MKAHFIIRVSNRASRTPISVNGVNFDEVILNKLSMNEVKSIYIR